MVPGDRPIISIGYKYNVWKFFSFIVTENAWIKYTVLYYLLSNLTSFIILTFTLLLFPLSCISPSDLLMSLTPTTN